MSVLAATAVLVGSCASGQSDTAPEQSDALPYADTGWVTLHGGPANQRQQYGVEPAQEYSRWSALSGATVLTAPVLLPNGNLAVTTGQSEGRSNLYVLDKNGDIVWESAPWQQKHGVDSGAVISSPIVGRDGNIFVSDGDQLWSYTQTGTLRWVTPLPEPPVENPYGPGSRAINPFITAGFTDKGAVLGVTTFGQVVVVDRDTGELRAPVFQLPGPLAAPVESPPHLWGDGLMDPAIIAPIYQIALGGTVRSANTPAVDADTGRVFVTATDKQSGRGALYGLDVTPPTGSTPGSIDIAFSTQMGPGSGSSPALSPNGKYVYTCDKDGLLYALDTATGEIAWTAQSNAAAAAVSVDKSGNIYVLTNPGVISAFGKSGDKLWEADLSKLKNKALPTSPTLGEPIIHGNGNPTIVDGAILVSAYYGYSVPVNGHAVKVPVKSAIVAIDPKTGKGMRNLAFTSDTTEGILAVLPDGRMFATLGAMATSSIAPLAERINPQLPVELKAMTPRGGLNGFTPVK